jgi:hypothetical protein
MISDEASRLFAELDGRLEDVAIRYGYQETRLAGAAVDDDTVLCHGPMLGCPVLGGAEDGRSVLYGMLGVREGRVRRSRNCQGGKVKAMGLVQNIELPPSAFPDTAMNQVIHFGDMLTLACIPGEPTTETGRRICTALSSMLSHRPVAAIANANGYVSYIATREEYEAQHYEGAFTLFGPGQAAFFQNQLSRLLTKIGGPCDPFGYEKARTFIPGSTGKAKPARSGAKKGRLGVVTKKFLNGMLASATFCWRSEKIPCTFGHLPEISVECEGRTAVNSEGAPENDQGLNFEIRYLGHEDWSATWYPPPGMERSKTYHFRITSAGQAPITSPDFQLR